MSNPQDDMTIIINGPERMLKVENEQMYIRQKLDEISNSLQSFTESAVTREQANRFTKKELIIFTVSSAIGSTAFVGALFAGAMWLISTKTDPIVATSLAAQSQIADRLNAMTQQYTERANQQSEFIKGLRADDNDIWKSIAGLTTRMATSELRTDQLNKDWDRFNAKEFDARVVRLEDRAKIEAMAPGALPR